MGRLIAACIGTTLALAVAWLAAGRLPEPEPPPIQLIDGRERLIELQEFLGERGTERPGALRGKAGHLLLNEPMAEFVFAFESQGMVYDPQAYYRRPAFQQRRLRWPEHPAGRWNMRTNALGLREDGPLDPQATRRLVAIGDSHTDGVCENDESWPNLLEAQLAATQPGVEVLNAGTGGYSFYNYLGAYDRFRDLDLDAYLVCVYGGNDFLGALGPHRFFQGLEIPDPDDDKQARYAARRVSEPALSQGFFSYDHFARHPEDEDLAVEAALATMTALAARCAEDGVALWVIYLPPLYDAESDQQAEQIAELREIYGLDDRDMASTDRMADRMLAGLEQTGIQIHDLRPAIRATEDHVFWDRDHHLDLEGHALVARELLPLLR